MVLAGNVCIQDAVAVVLPRAVSDRAYGIITEALSAVLATSPGLIVAVLIAGWRPDAAPNHCRRYGSSLRGNVSKRCLECGEAI